MTPPGESAAVRPREAPPRLSPAGPRVLVCDDDPFIREILCRWLADEGYPCDTAADAGEALALLDRRDYALLLSDIRMPGASGIDLLTTIKRRHPDLAVVMVTAIEEKDVAVRALELGAYGYIIKPFDLSEVVINVVNALERRRLVLEGRRYEETLERKVREQTRSIRATQEEIALRLIAASEFRDDETGAHIRRIGRYAEVLAAGMGRGPAAAETLRLASPMHDVGKIGIPDAILQKPGSLDPEERRVMEAHTSIGSRILAGTGIELLDVAEQIALSHHERWDGSGYPRGLAGGEIPEPARIVAVLDVYDALVHPRVYRPALPEAEALRILEEGKGRHFDPVILDLFMEALPDIRAICAEIRDAGKIP